MQNTLFFVIGASIINKISDYVDTIAVPGLNLQNECKIATILNTLQDIKTKYEKQPIILAITDLGNSIFPGQRRGKCYVFRKRIPTAIEYAKKFHEFVRKITDILPEARILIVPTLIRRPYKCHKYCNNCIFFVNPVEKLKMIYEIHSDYYRNFDQIHVISYEQIMTYFCKNQTKISFQNGCPVSFIAKELLNCSICRHKHNDYIHPCCREAIKKYGTFFQDLFRDFCRESGIN